MQHIQHFHLDTPQTLALRLGAGDRVRVSHGCIWLTLEGHSRDVWLRAHDGWSLPLHAKVWISSADAASRFTVSSHARAPEVLGAAPPQAALPANLAAA